MTDKQLAIRARRRLAIIEANDITNDAIEYYKTMVDNFYTENHLSKSSKSGFSITKKMNVQQRKEMRNILRSFMKDEEPSPTGIRKEYERKFSYYSEETNRLEVFPASTLKEMNESSRKLDRVLGDRAIKRYLDSDQIRALVNHAGSTGKSFNQYRTALLEMVRDSINDDLMSRGKNREVDIDDILLDDAPDPVLYENYSDDELVDEVIARVMNK